MASKVPSTSTADIAKKVEAVKKAFQTKETVGLEWRKKQLRQLKACLVENWESVRPAFLRCMSI
jgi:acyl-CoA reductase-like NAD-dependent aldehyde dehydrogenase